MGMLIGIGDLAQLLKNMAAGNPVSYDSEDTAKNAAMPAGQQAVLVWVTIDNTPTLCKKVGNTLTPYTEGY